MKNQKKKRTCRCVCVFTWEEVSDDTKNFVTMFIPALNLEDIELFYEFFLFIWRENTQRIHDSRVLEF